MVRVNAIKQIEKFVEENHIRQMRCWTLRSTRSKFFNELIVKIKKLLDLISGDSTVQMLKSKYFKFNLFCTTI